MRTPANWNRRIHLLEAILERRQTHQQATLNHLAENPCQIMRVAGLEPDPWQAQLLQHPAERTLLLCSRQAGKSSIAAALALRCALLDANATILVLSPTLRQSGELFRKIAALYQALGCPIAAHHATSLRLELANGSRIVSLPGSEGTIRGFSGVTLLIIDEAARVQDALYYSVRPMLAVSQGKLIGLSTPFGKRGWFYDAWISHEPWHRVRILATDCPRITPEFLAEERQALGERWYMQEYLCSFEETIDAVFAYADIQAALSEDVPPLFPLQVSRPC